MGLHCERVQQENSLSACLTMFEDKVAAVLQKQLGAFVEGLDAKSLNIGVWSGQIVLENLQARSAVLETCSWC